ncbi:hypothetical protein GpartN1_g410.t1 [Galdieria partita]|uniref:DNA polymerase V n=1 Tax=Galdieria partita TaxID=83374 RepID=A0A9C7UMG6_9RHOD|nr:hypothetical protein GpartN1_g410.t1 [Galdieria partita]
MVGVANATANKLPVSQKVLDCFWSLASENEQERVVAAKVLCEELDNVDDEDDAADYVYNRLVAGLSSSRAAARQGFAVAMTMLLKYRASKQQISSNYTLAHKLASKLEKQLDNIKMGDNTEALRETRENILGTLFGIAAIAKTGLVGVERILTLLQRLVSQKKWSTGLTDAVLRVAIESLTNVERHSFRKKGSKVRKAVVQWINQRGIRNPDTLALALFCKNQYEIIDLSTECQYWCEEDPVTILIKEENPFVKKSDVKDALDSVFYTGSYLPSGHIPYVWYVWLDSLSNTPQNYFAEWWSLFVRQQLLQQKSSTERVLLGLRFTVALLERNPMKKQIVFQVVDDFFLSCLFYCCCSSKNHVVQEAVALKENLVVCIEKLSGDDLHKHLIETLSKFAFELSGYVDQRLLSLSAIKLSLESVSELCDHWRKNFVMNEKSVKMLSVIFAHLSSDDARACLFRFIQEKMFQEEHETSQKWKESILNAVGSALKRQDNVVLLRRLVETSLSQYKELPIHRKPKVNRIFEFCRQQINEVESGNRESQVALLACSLSILICLFTEEDEIDNWLQHSAWSILKELTQVEEDTDEDGQELKNLSLVKFLLTCLSFESHGIRQIVNYIFEKVVPMCDENIFSLLLSYLPGHLQWKELRQLKDPHNASDISTGTHSDPDEASFSSEMSDSRNSTLSSDNSENDETVDEFPLVDQATLSDLDMDKDPDEEDEETLEAYDKKVSAMLKEMDSKYVKNAYRRKSHEALRILDLVELTLHAQNAANETRIQLPCRLWLSVMEMNDIDWVNRVDSILQKVFLRETIVPSVSAQHYLNEVEFLKEILHRFYSDTKLLSDEAFRTSIVIFAYLLKGIHRRYKLDSNCEIGSENASLQNFQGYEAIDELIQIFSCQPFGITCSGKVMKDKFSSIKVTLLEENLWKRFPFACFLGVKCLCTVYNKSRSRFMKRTCLKVLQTAVKLATNKKVANSTDYQWQSKICLLENQSCVGWLESLRSFLVTTICSFQLCHYHDLFAKCINIILLLLKNGYDLGEEICELLQRKLSEYPRKQIPSSVVCLFQSFQKESMPMKQQLGKRDAEDLLEKRKKVKRM